MSSVLRTVAAACTIASLAGLARGQVDVFWANPNGGVWSDAFNWSPAQVPNNSGPNLFNAFLALDDQPYTVMLDVDVTLENFGLLWGGVTLDMGVSSLTVNQDLTIRNGTVYRMADVRPDTMVGGTLTLDNASLLHMGRVVSTGTMILEGDEIEICNTEIDHESRGDVHWQGPGTLSIEMEGSFTNGALSTFRISPDSHKSISGDKTGSFTNEGVLVNGDSSRGINGITTLSDVAFFNTGTVVVEGGGLILMSTNELAPNGTLSDGAWVVKNGAFLDMGGQQISRLGASVSLEGPNAAFGEILGLNQVLETGRFAISDGYDFTARGSFHNAGSVTVGEGSVFDTSAGGLGNIDGQGLYGGTFDVAGSFLTGADRIEFVGADLTLRGARAEFTGIDALNRVGGRFALESGASFRTEGDLTVDRSGTLRVGVDSDLAVTGRLASTKDGVLAGGRYEVAGTLSANGLRVTEIAAELVLEGTGSRLLDQAGNDALRDLGRIGRDGALLLREGRSLNVAGDFRVDNLLSIDGGQILGDTTSTQTPGTVNVAGHLLLTADSTLELLIRGADPAHYGQVLAVTTTIEEGATLSIVVQPGADVSYGDEFLLLQTGRLEGVFINLLGLEIDETLRFEIEHNSLGVFARVVPTPGTLGVVLVGVFAARRRRG